MGTEYICATVKEFFDKLDRIEKNLSNFSQEIDGRRRQIHKILSNILQQSNQFQVQVMQSGNPAVDKALSLALQDIETSLEDWTKKLDSNLKGIDFMKKHEKYLVVMVFGAVKAGKSSLGNFFAGKDFAATHFDTEYKHRGKPEFISEESHRETGGLVKENNGDTWFTEGVTDTTGAIQYFTLSGLRWMDSPGTGAISLGGDTIDMEAMVNEYITYADLCIFLMNSSEPGLQADMKYMEKLSREGQESLVVITRSDEQEEDVDENGEIIKILKAKDSARRKLQEDDIVQRLSKDYPDLDAEKFRAISVSTLLARHALEQNDEEKFKESNLDTLMNILADKASSQTVALKTLRPKKNMNSFINLLINGDKIDHSFKGITELLEDFYILRKPIEEYKVKIESHKQRIINLIVQNIQSNLKTKLSEWNKYVESTQKSVDSDMMNSQINATIEEEINKGISLEIGQIIEGYNSHRKTTLETLVKVESLGKSYEEVAHTYKEYELIERSPDGIVENLKSFFGKTYYKTRTVTRTDILKIDVGTNINTVLESLINQSRLIITDEVQKALAEIQKSYFLPQEEYIDTMVSVLQQSLKNLESLTYGDI